MNESTQRRTGLTRQMGLLGLAATGICSMMGASINIVPFMLQRNVPEIGPNVVYAYLFAIIPAVLAALPYAILASAMPRAGGSYVYASRALNPYLGFVASFSQWFGLSIAIGVVSYVIVPFVRDIFDALGWTGVVAFLEIPNIRLLLALAFLWVFVWVNLRGLRLYERTLIPLMVLMFITGFVLIIAGFYFNQQDFIAATAQKTGQIIPPAEPFSFNFGAFLAASAILFSSFIGFDSIAQAGGEAKNPGRTLPLAIGVAILTVGLFDLLFTGAVYHAVPWQYISQEAQLRDLTAPGLLGVLLPVGWTVLIVSGAAIALINDLPAMLLSVSRLMFAWAEDGIFPKSVAKVHPKFHTPQLAIVLSACMASVGILGSHFAGDFFLGVDILVTSMLVNFLLMSVSILFLHRKNPTIASGITVLKSRKIQIPLGILGVLTLGGFLGVHIWKDINAEVSAWYFHSTPVWLAVMAIASIIYLREMRKLKASGADVDKIFGNLPPE